MQRRSFLASGATLIATCVALLAAVQAGPIPANAQPAATPAATQAANQPATAAPSVSTDSGVTQIHGNVKITNQSTLGDSAEPMVVLLDFTAFIKRDHDAHLPFADQTIAGVYTDPAKGTTDLANGAQYTMPLPIEPRGTINNVAHGKGGKGVMVFSVDFDTNAVGDAFMGPHEITGWSNGADGLEFDPGTLEVSQGEFLVWAPDDNQLVPTGFGADGKLFTDDDPVGPVKRGWTVIKILPDKTKPFQQIRTAHADVPILEGLTANNDLSNLSYTAAFDELVKELRVRYTYTEFKHLNWDQIVKDIRPLVQQAEQDKSTEEFNVAILKFVGEFHDGHVGTSSLPPGYFDKQAGGGLGLVLGQLDDGTVIAREVVPKLPADKAGIKAGAKISQWNGQPIAQAVKNTPLLFVTESSPIPTLLQQLIWIERSPAGTKVTIQFQNPGDSSPKSADLTSVKERVSLTDAPLVKSQNLIDMPLSYNVLQQGNKYYAYVKVTIFETDSVYLSGAWETALTTFNQLGVQTLIVDMRQNPGGSPITATYFAGSFYTDPFDLAAFYLADKSGNFVYEGKQTILPSPVQWTGPVAVLIGPDCASACEIFSGAMAHDKNHLMVGYYPTAGVEAGIEYWTLPDGLNFQAPTERLVDPTTQKPFLEGVGVQPNVKVPVTAANLLSTEDPQLLAAEQALDKQLGAAGGQ